MGFVLFQTDKVRQALKRREGVGIDALLLIGIAGTIAAGATIAGHVAGARPRAVQISLSLHALPRYAMYSLARAFVAYAISLVFTLVYGTISAHNRVAEKFMIPLLDVLQSLPVLSFLPGLVLLFVRLFPTSWLGLELACVVMIFTAQAWNMTFSYHGSVRAIPDTLREAAAIQHLSGWQIFRYLEVPASMIGLVWNSMMSMAGGWFIITVNEAFTLNGTDYRLPGLGSYMNQAQSEWNIPAMIYGVTAMILVIVAVDQLFWRPIVVWSERFKMEDTSGGDAPTSWVLNLFQRSSLLIWLRKKWRQVRTARASARERDPITRSNAPRRPRRALPAPLLVALRWTGVAAMVVLPAWGAWVLLKLLAHLPLFRHGDAFGWSTVLAALGASFGRTSTAVILGALWTLPLGIVIGLSPKLSSKLQPIVQVVASFPAPMLFPIVVFLLLRVHVPFTLGCIGLMMLGTQWYTLFNVIAGAMAIPSNLREAGEVFHLSNWQRWSRIYVPGVFPYLVTGLVTAAGGAWNATIVSEYLSLQHRDGTATVYSAFGLGSLINEATDQGNWSLLAASVVTMGVAVVIINRLLWRRVYRLAEDRYTLNT